MLPLTLAPPLKPGQRVADFEAFYTQAVLAVAATARHDLSGAAAAMLAADVPALAMHPYANYVVQQTVEAASVAVAQPVTPSSHGGNHWPWAVLHTREEPASHWARFQRLYCHL